MPKIKSLAYTPLSKYGKDNNQNVKEKLPNLSKTAPYLKTIIFQENKDME